MEAILNDIYIDRKKGLVAVGEAVCNIGDVALFMRSNTRSSINFREVMDSLNKPLEFGDKDQIMALQAYQAMVVWHENFYH